jgi:hydrogenase expression/formation protein HypC
MCLAIPGEIVTNYDDHGLAFARVRFGGVLKDVCIHAYPDVKPGDFVLVHVGFAIAKLDAVEAARTLALLRELGDLEDFASLPAEEPA